MAHEKETAGYKFAGVVEEFAPMGETLKPVHEMEIVDLTNPEELAQYQKYIDGLKDDVDTRKFYGNTSFKQDKSLLRKRAMANPGDMYVKADGKKTPLAKYLKNKKSLNSRENHDFAKTKDPRFEKENNNMKKQSPENYNSMVFNQQKAGE